ncbi:hypothetical protein, partial [Acinetobacter baumannii]|uniref:hypothetical protein n=1 Tax=Acinetobacter baumannii TaxID=470 RepID=UPI00197ADBFB
LRVVGSSPTLGASFSDIGLVRVIKFIGISTKCVVNDISDTNIDSCYLAAAQWSSGNRHGIAVLYGYTREFDPPFGLFFFFRFSSFSHYLY